MEKILEQRLVGAAVLILFGVIFIPIILAPPEKTPDQGGKPFIVLASPPEPSKAFASHLEPIGKVESPTGQAAVPVTRAPPTPVATVEKVAEKAPVRRKAKKETGKGIAINHQHGQQTTDGANNSASTGSDPVNAKANGALTAWAVQIGSFSKRQNALDRERYLRKKGYRAFVESVNTAKNGDANNRITRVLIGPQLLQKEASRLAKKLQAELGMEGLVLRYP